VRANKPLCGKAILMDEKERFELYKRAIYKWGPDPQFRQLQEELAEFISDCAILIAKINHADRGRVDVAELAEEVADVEIMIEMVRAMIGDQKVSEFKEMKLERLRKRLEKDGG